MGSSRKDWRPRPLFNPDLFRAGLIGGRAAGRQLGLERVDDRLPRRLQHRHPDPARRAVVPDSQGPALARLEGTGGRLRPLLPECGGHRGRLTGGSSLPTFARHCPSWLGRLCSSSSWERRQSTGRPAAGVHGRDPSRLSSPRRGWSASLALLAAVAWLLLLRLPQSLKTGVPVLVPIASGLALAGGSMALIRRWSDRRGSWGDHHRLALVIGSLPPVMLFGFLVVTSAQPRRSDRTGDRQCGGDGLADPSDPSIAASKLGKE